MINMYMFTIMYIAYELSDHCTKLTIYTIK